MALSTNEAATIQNRFLAIERKLNELQVALNNLVTKAQSKALLNIRQNEIIDLQETLEQLQRVNGAVLLDVHEADSDAHAALFADYYKRGSFVDSTTGIVDAGKPLKLDSTGKLDPSLVELSFEDHSTLSGLDGDDHLQYHTDARGDARYYLQSQIDAYLATKSDTGHSHDDLYYTESEVDTLLSGYSETTHLHDDRYYTEGEVDSLLTTKSDTSHLHDDRYYTENETDALLSGVNHGDLENLLNDDHTQYSLVDGSRAFTSTVAGVSPTDASHLATKEYVDDAVTEVIYVGDSILLNNGVLDSGNLASTQTIDDSDTYNVSEVTGVPGFNIEFTFSSIAAFDYVRVHAQYTGSPTHSVLVQLYNYNTTDWDTKAALEPTGTYQYINQAIASDTNYIDGSGNARLRIYHVTNGNTSHDILVDYVALSKAGIGYTADHGGLTGLLDDDHSQYHNDTRGDARYYTQSQIDISLSGKSDIGHSHDDLYYTEAEIDILLAGYSVTGHDHNDIYYTESEADALLATKSTVGHDHDTWYYRESEVDSLLSGKSDTSHLHDDRYYTESEVDTLLSGVNHGDLEGLTSDDHSQYLTEGRADTWLGTKTTSDLTEGTNQYYTEGRVSANTDVSANTSARHSHSNKAQLDLVTDGDHDVRSDNPHSVTAAQVGAPTTDDLTTHTSDNTIHFTEASIDHGTISGLDDDDHSQYLLVDGSRRVTSNFIIDGDLTFYPDVSTDIYIGTGGGNIILTSPIVTGPILFDSDTGPTTLFDMPVTSTPSAGDEMSVAFAIDSNTIAAVYAQADGVGGIQAPSFKIGAARFQGSKGSDVASADEITLGNGNYFNITGTTTINHINKTDWQAGSIVVLQFNASVTVVHNAGSPTGTEADILLAGAANFSATADDTLTLVYDGVTWRETSRTVI